MSKRNDRIPIWKIATLAALAAAAAVGLLTARTLIRVPPATQPAADPRAQSASNMSGLLLLLGLMGVAVTLLCIGWLGYRWYLTIPAWKRRKGPPRRR